MVKEKDPNTKRLSRLARIKLTEGQQEAFDKKLQRILSYMDLLEEVSTEGLAPCVCVFETLKNPLAEDATGAVLSRDEFLATTPQQVGGMVKIPPVMTFEE